jgi:hypothetical protein
MTTPGRRWTIKDRDGNAIYLTGERWSHISGPLNHPEMADYEEHLKRPLREGRRKQEPLKPRKYRYTHAFNDLPGAMTHIVAVALFGFDVTEDGDTIANNFVATAYMKHMQTQGD